MNYCKYCGKPVTGRKKGAQYCSSDCQKRRNRQGQMKPELSETPWERWFRDEWDKARFKLLALKKEES